MRPHVLSATIFLLCVSALSPGMSAIDATDTKLLTQPAISANHIAFIYAGDLFVADRTDGNGAANVANVRRLTTDDGVESPNLAIWTPEDGWVVVRGCAA